MPGRKQISTYGRHRQRVVTVDPWSSSDTSRNLFSSFNSNSSDSINHADKSAVEDTTKGKKKSGNTYGRRKKKANCEEKENVSSKPARVTKKKSPIFDISDSSNASDSSSYPLRDLKNTSLSKSTTKKSVKPKKSTKKTKVSVVAKKSTNIKASDKSNKTNVSVMEKSASFQSMNFSEFEKYSLILDTSPDSQQAVVTSPPAIATPPIESKSSTKLAVPTSAFTSTPHLNKGGHQNSGSHSRPSMGQIEPIISEDEDQGAESELKNNCVSRLESILGVDVSSIAELNSPASFAVPPKNQNQVIEISDYCVNSPQNELKVEGTGMDASLNLLTPCTRAANNSMHVTGRRRMLLRSDRKKSKNIVQNIALLAKKNQNRKESDSDNSGDNSNVLDELKIKLGQMSIQDVQIQVQNKSRVSPESSYHSAYDASQSLFECTTQSQHPISNRTYNLNTPSIKGKNDILDVSENRRSMLLRSDQKKRSSQDSSLHNLHYQDVMDCKVELERLSIVERKLLEEQDSSYHSAMQSHCQESSEYRRKDRLQTIASQDESTEDESHINNEGESHDHDHSNLTEQSVESQLEDSEEEEEEDLSDIVEEGDDTEDYVWERKEVNSENEASEDSEDEQKASDNEESFDEEDTEESEESGNESECLEVIEEDEDLEDLEESEGDTRYTLAEEEVQKSNASVVDLTADTEESDEENVEDMNEGSDQEASEKLSEKELQDLSNHLTDSAYESGKVSDKSKRNSVRNSVRRKTIEFINKDMTEGDHLKTPNRLKKKSRMDALREEDVMSLSFRDTLTPVKSSKSGAPLSPKEKVLLHCGQDAPISFTECITPAMMKKCVKIGEGVYGEVFKTERNKASVALKVIPIEGDFEVNDEPQKTFGEMLSEIVISKELSDLRNNTDNNTNNFVEVKHVSVVQGSYPPTLLSQWDAYHKRKGSENDRPDMFNSEQLFIVFEFEECGCDLEAFKFENIDEAKSVLVQVACSLAIAESAFQFEHRDLHWGNVLIKRVKQKTIEYKLGGDEFEIDSCGVKVSIIDFTLSRLFQDGCSVFCDLSTDPTLFEGIGDYQFDVYRLMKDENGNSWGDFHPFTNVLWLHYLADKLIKATSYPHSRTKAHQIVARQFRTFLREALDFQSSIHLIAECSFFH